VFIFSELVIGFDAMAAAPVSGKVRKSCQTSATSRLKQDYIRIKSDPVPYISAEPLHSNILEWYVDTLRPCVMASYLVKVSWTRRPSRPRPLIKTQKFRSKNLVHGRLEEGWVREESGGRGM